MEAIDWGSWLLSLRPIFKDNEERTFPIFELLGTPEGMPSIVPARNIKLKTVHREGSGQVCSRTQ
jgi:hypothetical protein